MQAEDTVADDKVSKLKIGKQIVRVPRITEDLLVYTNKQQPSCCCKKIYKNTHH